MKNILKSGVSLLFLSLFLVFAVGSGDEFIVRLKYAEIEFKVLN